MSKRFDQARFCPYCGKQLSQRSQYCPYCGKASPKRVRRSTSEDPSPVSMSARVEAEKSRTVSTGAATSRASERAEHGATTGGPNSLRLAPVGASGVPVATVARRYAPPTHALIGAFEQAGFGLRYGAWMFDFLIILIATMVFTFIVTALSHRSVVGSNIDLVIVAGLTLLLLVLNFVVLAGANGQTAGMRILGIYIVRVDGTPFTRKHAALRHLVGYPLSMAALFLGFLWMLWDPRQQAWHDKLARTIVVMSR